MDPNTETLYGIAVEAVQAYRRTKQAELDNDATKKLADALASARHLAMYGVDVDDPVYPVAILLASALVIKTDITGNLFLTVDDPVYSLLCEAHANGMIQNRIGRLESLNGFLTFCGVPDVEAATRAQREADKYAKSDQRI